MDGPRRFFRALALLVAIWGAVGACPVVAQDQAAWLTDLAVAQQQAAQTGRLVLVHVWAPWCGPCQQMERDVLSDPAVRSALAQRFVLVKLNYDLHGSSLQHLNVDLLPSDVILAPDGRLLSRSRGKLDANAYVAKLSQLAEQVSTPLVARAAASPATTPAPSPALPPTPGDKPMAVEQPPAAVNMPATNASSAEAPVAPGPMQGARWPVNGAPPAPPNSGPLGLDGYCPVTLCQTRVWVAGELNYALSYEGRVYRFAGVEQLRQFQADPARFAPVAGGVDPVLLTEQRGVHTGRREHGVFWHGQIYLFASEESLTRFAQSPRQYAGALRQAQLGRPTDAVMR